MTIETVAILSPGEMGAGVGGALSRAGYSVITTLEGRGGATRERAIAAGFRDGGPLAEVVGAADLVLSILPPEHALGLAEAVAAAMRDTGRTPPFTDCNAVAPETAVRIGRIMTETGAAFIDGGIIGAPPGPSSRPRFFVSGPGVDLLRALDGEGIAIKPCGPEIGRGSAIKMAYAGITKGTSALHAAMLIAAERLGVADELHEELQYSQKGFYRRMESMTPALPAVSGRYVGEMLEIAKTMESCALTPVFHEGAAELYRLLAGSPFASERRDTVDPTRGLRRTIEVCAEVGSGNG